MNYPRYPEYKPSGVEWLGEVPAHWGLKRLKYIASHNDDVLPETTDPDYVMQYVDISSVTLAKGIEKTEEYMFEKAPSRARRKVRDGDTIVSTVRTYLKAIAPIEAPEDNLVVSTGFAVIRPRAGITPHYLAYQLQTQGFVDAVVANSVGVSYPAINASQLVTLPALTPGEDEQRAIAAFLDRETARIDALIAKKQRLIELLAEKRTALISQAVTKGLNPGAPMKDSGVEWLGEIPAHWEAVKGRYIGRLFSSPTVSDDDLSFDGEINYIKVDDLNRDDLSFNLETSRNKVVNDTYNKFAQSGFLLFPKRGAAIFTNKVCIVAAPSLFDPNLMGWRIAQEFCREYMAYVLLARRLDDLADVSTVPQINNKHIYPEKFPAPPKNEQLAIVAHLNKEVRRLNGIGQNVNGAIERLREYRTAIISAAVTGKIDVRSFVQEREVA